MTIGHTPLLSPKEVLTKAMLDVVPKIVKGSFNGDDSYRLKVEIERPANADHGDYSSNIAMKLFGLLKAGSQSQNNKEVAVTITAKNEVTSSSFTSPRELASKIVESLSSLGPKENPCFSRFEVAGAGFINAYLSDQFALSKLEQLEGYFEGGTVAGSDKSLKVIVEFTDPNPFKEFHIGHLYSNTVGESISRLLEFAGFEVKRANYQGDVGMHVAKSIWGMTQKLSLTAGADGSADQSLSEALDRLDQSSLKDKVKFLGESYASGASAFEDDPVAKKEITDINRLVFISAQEHLQETTGWQPQVDYGQKQSELGQDYKKIKDLYQKGRSWSLEAFDQIYARLGTAFSYYYFESLVAEYGIKIVREFLAKGVFEESKGAVIFPGSKYGLHDRVFINSLGFPTYEAKELGLAIEKYRRYPYDLSYIITANEIDEYFKVLLCALGQVRPDLASRTTHLSHGMVRLPEGKMSSRKGNVLTGEWLIDEAKSMIRVIVDQNHPEFSDKEKSEISEVVGVGAVKFALLKVALGHDIAFSFESSLSFEGHSGPYIQYTYARSQAVLRKASELGLDKNHNFVIDESVASGLNSEERALLHQLYFFTEVVERCVAESAPHHLCIYLFELSQAFNLFYSKHSIVKEEAKGKVDSQIQQTRLLLTQSVGLCLKQGLHLLGIRTVSRM